MNTIDTSPLLKCAAPWIHLISAPSSDRLPYHWPFGVDSDATVVRLRGRKMQTLSGLFDEFAAALQFPDYFGENWPAFNDVIADLGWMPRTYYELVITDADRVLSNEPDVEFAVFLNSLNRAGETWSKPIKLGEPWDRTAVPFHSVLVAESEAQADLKRRVEGAGVALSEL